jgi:hypothetical protein
MKAPCMITTVGPFTGSKYQQFGLVMMMVRGIP